MGVEFLTAETKYLSNLSGMEIKKYLHKKSIIRHLYQQSTMSNTELSKCLNLSTPTITTLLNELIDDELVQDYGLGSSSGGRRPNLYGLKKNSLFALGIDMGRYTTRMAILNNHNEKVTDIKYCSIKMRDEIEVVNEVYANANKLIEDSGIDREKLIGIGIDMPGLVDSSKGTNETYSFDKKRTVKQIFEEKFKKPVFIENDAKVMALGEYRFGLAQGKKDVLTLNIGWGVGLGMILDGRLYRGSGGFAGEFSHIQLLEDGPLCTCGKLGCLETVGSATALARLAKEGIAAGKISHLKYMVNEDLDKLEAKIIIKAANQGDQYAIHILSKVGQQLGKGIATLIQLFNPELIILGGRLSQAGQYIIAPIQQSLNKYCIPRIREDAEIQISELGQNAAVMGAVALVMENIFNSDVNVFAEGGMG